MPNLPVYPFDPTGVASTNLISGEEQAIQAVNFKDSYLIIPDVAPFYGDSIVVKYTDTVSTLKTLVEGIDYSLVLPYWVATKSIGKLIYGGIIIFNTSLTGTISLDYQTIGGQWASNSSEALVKLTEEIYNPRTVVWDVLVSIQTTFPPFDHTESVQNIFGMDLLTSKLSSVMGTIAANPTETIFKSINFPKNSSALVSIAAPSITSPTYGNLNEPINLMFLSTPFALSSGIDIQISASWELSTDILFTNIVQSSMNNTGHLTDWSVLGLSNSTEYYVRVQYTGASGNTSPWSSPLKFSTISAITTIANPAITFPINGASNLPSVFTMEGTPFALTSGSDTQARSSWEIATDSAFTNIVKSSINDTINLTNWPVTGLSASTGYYSRVMYTGASGVSSKWSSTIYFTTGVAPIVIATPSITSPINGSSNIALSLTATSTPFTLTSGVDTAATATWEIATDNGFTNIVATASGSTNAITSWPVSGLSNSITYYIRVMYIGTSGKTSLWSNTIYFTTAANSILGIGVFGGGNDSLFNTVSSTSIYTYSTNNATAGGNLSYFSSNLAAAGNATIGVFGGGNDINGFATAVTAQYIYSSNISMAGGNLSISNYYLSAAGNTTLGIFSGGYTAAGINITNTAIYTYSSNISIAGGNLSYGVTGLTAAGNNTTGLFGGCLSATGVPLSAVSLYTYSSNTSTIGSNLTYMSQYGAAVSNSTVAIFGAGDIVSTTSIYTYSTNATMAGSNLSYAAWDLAAAGNDTTGVFGGGLNWDQSIVFSSTSIYRYSTNVAIAGSNLNYGMNMSAACGPNPGVNA